MLEVQLASIMVQTAIKLKRKSRNGPNPHSMDGTHLTRIRIKPDASEALD